MVYLALGVMLSPKGLGYLAIDPAPDSRMLEHVSEVAVVVSLFVCGLKIQLKGNDPLWKLPLRLAFVSMAVTVALIALAGVLFLDLDLGLAVLLGAVLAPTDPVLASDVQVEDIHDRDQVRFALTGEASFNDGAAFPFMLLGLGLLGYHDLGTWGERWVLVDVLWGVLGGLMLGAVFGAAAGLGVRRMADCPDREGVHEFLAFGLVFAAYGVAMSLHTHGFLAAFTAGLALRWMEAPGEPDAERSAMSHNILGFKERIERLLEAFTVILVGAVVAQVPWDQSLLWFAPLLFLVVRPAAVLIGLVGTQLGKLRRGYISWLGIRGVGSVYYLAYAAGQGVPGPHIEGLAGLVYPILALSIVIHGLSVSPLMKRYSELTESS